MQTPPPLDPQKLLDAQKLLELEQASDQGFAAAMAIFAFSAVGGLLPFFRAPRKLPVLFVALALGDLAILGPRRWDLSFGQLVPPVAAGVLLALTFPWSARCIAGPLLAFRTKVAYLGPVVFDARTRLPRLEPLLAWRGTLALDARRGGAVAGRRRVALAFVAPVVGLALAITGAVQLVGPGDTAPAARALALVLLEFSVLGLILRLGFREISGQRTDGSVLRAYGRGGRCAMEAAAIASDLTARDAAGLRPHQWPRALVHGLAERLGSRDDPEAREMRANLLSVAYEDRGEAHRALHEVRAALLDAEDVLNGETLGRALGAAARLTLAVEGDTERARRLLVEAHATVGAPRPELLATEVLVLSAEGAPDALIAQAHDDAARALGHRPRTGTIRQAFALSTTVPAAV